MSPVGLYDAPELDEAGNREIARDYLAHLCTGEDPASFDTGKRLTKEAVRRMLNRSNRLVYAEFKKERKYGQHVTEVHQTVLL